MLIDYQDQFDQMVENVGSFFGRDKIESAARRDFIKYRDEVLVEVPTMDADLLKTQPYSAAIGFLGKVQFEDGPALKEFKKDPTAVSLTRLRKSQGLRMADSAIGSWEFLDKGHPVAALAVIVLSSMAIKNAKVKHALKPSKN